jgi:acetylornithine/LysW-gamma-L-lysine aminotransferase
MSQSQGASQAWLERDAKHHTGLWSPNLVLTHGKGVYIYDADGNEYLDCMAGIAVASVGHANARLQRALAEQAGKLIICSQAHANDTRVRFYEKLFGFIPASMGLTRVFLANSGSEVNEAALKWARVATGRRKFVAAKRGFSGRTLGVLSLTWEQKYREPFLPLPYEPEFIAYNDVGALEQAIDDDTAAVFLEPVQGEGGMHVAEGAFLQAARELTRERRALLIMDEVQSGVARTGKFLASEHFDLAPDMLTLAKGLGGGVPIGALLMSDEVAKAMPAGGHGTTFGGNALAAAAGLAVLEEIEERGLIEHAAEVGRYFQAQLRALEAPQIRTVRGLGLMIGVEFKEKVAPIVAALKEAGVLVINAGSTVIRFVPPLIISKGEVDEVVRRLGKVLAQHGG